mgnify:FL=1
MNKEDLRKKLQASLELKKQMLQELRSVQLSVQKELQTTGRIVLK